jgi:ribosomal protein S18 acetylase RimI-like enzyme
LLAGAILLTLPDEPQPGPEVAEISAQAWRELGDDARLRYEEYTRASNFFADYPPHLHLNMIGVRRGLKGSGLGRSLLEKTRALAEENPSWHGVSLTTENPRNIDLYQYFGYEKVGHGTFGPGLQTWGLYLRLR